MEVRAYPYKILQLVIGSFIAAFSIRNFIAAHGLLTGGVAGVALILNYLFQVPLGLTIVLLNLPLLLLGLHYLHFGYLVRTLIGVVSLSLFLHLVPVLPALHVNDLLLAALFGGFLNGIGFGLMFRGRGSAGGTDIIALVLHRLYAYGVGEVNLAFNTLIVLASAMLFDLRRVGYTLVALAVSAYIVDQLQMGFRRAKTVIIVSDRSAEIAEAIMHKLHRGVTFLEGEGAFTHTRKQVILTSVPGTQLAKLKDLVANLDQCAFVMVGEATEVLGKGFISICDRW